MNHIYRLHHYIFICNDTMTKHRTHKRERPEGKLLSVMIKAIISLSTTDVTVHSQSFILAVFHYYTAVSFCSPSVKSQSESPSSTPTAPTAPASSSSLPRRRSPGHIQTNSRCQYDLSCHCQLQSLFTFICVRILDILWLIQVKLIKHAPLTTCD